MICLFERGDAVADKFSEVENQVLESPTIQTHEVGRRALCPQQGYAAVVEIRGENRIRAEKSPSQTTHK